MTEFPPTPFPTIVASGSGLIHVYKLTPAQMIAFGQWLWVTYADATIDKIWSNPMDGIIGAFEIYATPSTDDNDYIRSGFLVSDVQGALVNPRYKRINCGSIVIPEYYANYLDYSPYSKAHICLPFIGVVELNSDDIVGHAVNVTYIIDMYNGSCIAQITVAKDNYECMMYQYSGNCAVDVPIAGGSQAAIKAGMIGAAANGITSVLAGLAAGGPIGGIAGAAVGMGGGVIGAALSNKASVQHSGTFGSSLALWDLRSRTLLFIDRFKSELPTTIKSMVSLLISELLLVVALGSCVHLMFTLSVRLQPMKKKLRLKKCSRVASLSE